MKRFGLSRVKPVALAGVALLAGAGLPLLGSGGAAAGANTATEMMALVVGGGSMAPTAKPQLADQAELSLPLGVAIGANGVLYIADEAAGEVDEVSDGSITVLAGGGKETVSTTPQVPTDVALAPNGVAVDKSGNLYITGFTGSSLGVGVVAEISATTHKIALVAGGGSRAPETSSQLGTDVVLQAPLGIATDSSGDVFFTDGAAIATGPGSSSGEVDELTPSGDVTVVAGGGKYTNNVTVIPQPATAVNLSLPTGVAVDSSGDVYIVDSYNGVLDELSASTGDISVVAGGGLNSPTTSPMSPLDADLGLIIGVAIGPTGAVYLAREDTAEIYAITNGSLALIAGGGSMPPTTVPMPPLEASMSDAAGLAVDASGDLFVSGSFDNGSPDSPLPAIFEIAKPPRITSISPTEGVLVDTPVSITGSGFFGAKSVYFGLSIADSFSCGDTSCNALSHFGRAGTTVMVTVTTPFGTSNGKPFTYLPARTKTSLKLSTPTAVYGQESKELLSVTVTPIGVDQMDGGKATVTGTDCSLEFLNLEQQEFCRLKPTSLSPGVAHLKAVFKGSTNDLPSSSPTVPLTVQKAPTTSTLRASVRSLTYGKEAKEHLSITVHAVGLPPVGAVSVSGEACTRSLKDGRANCVLKAKQLKVGTHKLTVTYKGNADFVRSTSKQIVIVVHDAQKGGKRKR